MIHPISTVNKQMIMTALNTFMRQRPGLEYGNYGDPKTYRAEVWGICRDLKDAKALFMYANWRDSITGEDIVQASQSAFSGRLQFRLDNSKLHRCCIDYCTGQYFPTEYRKAVCAVLAQAIWNDFRKEYSEGDHIRTAAREEFGKGIASRWFR